MNMLKKCLKNIAETWVIIMICIVQTDTLLLVDVFEKFRKKCIEIYRLDPSYFYSEPGLAWQACLKKTEVKTLTDIDMLLMVE